MFNGHRAFPIAHPVALCGWPVLGIRPVRPHACCGRFPTRPAMPEPHRRRHSTAGSPRRTATPARIPDARRRGSPWPCATSSARAPCGDRPLGSKGDAVPLHFPPQGHAERSSFLKPLRDHQGRRGRGDPRAYPTSGRQRATTRAMCRCSLQPWAACCCSKSLKSLVPR
jgi:hypothetical protein